MKNLNIAEMAQELVEKSNNSWTKSDKRKYSKTLKKILRTAEKGCSLLTIANFGDWSRVYKQLEEDGFTISYYGGTYIHWDLTPRPELYPPQGGTGEVKDSAGPTPKLFLKESPTPPKGHYITEGKDPRKIK